MFFAEFSFLELDLSESIPHGRQPIVLHAGTKCEAFQGVSRYSGVLDVQNLA